jgi:hypothetical protein
MLLMRHSAAFLRQAQQHVHTRMAAAWLFKSICPYSEAGTAACAHAYAHAAVPASEFVVRDRRPMRGITNVYR